MQLTSIDLDEAEKATLMSQVATLAEKRGSKRGRNGFADFKAWLAKRTELGCSIQGAGLVFS